MDEGGFGDRSSRLLVFKHENFEDSEVARNNVSDEASFPGKRLYLILALGHDPQALTGKGGRTPSFGVQDMWSALLLLR